MRSTVDVADKQRRPAGIQTSVQWNVKGTAPLPVSSPSNILPLLSSIALPFPQADIRRGSKMLFFYFLLNFF